MAEESAKGVITGFLGQYGLGALADRAWQMYLDGQSIEEIMLNLRSTDEYKARFPAMDALAKKGHAITEAEYVNIERQYTQLFRQYGLPQGFYDTAADFTSFIEGEVSPSELQERLQEHQRITYELPPQVREEMSRLYGLTAGDITAYIINPTKALPLLQNQFLAAESAAGAAMSGFGALTKDESERLAQFRIGFDEARQGFTALVDNRELFSALAGDEGDEAISRDEQLGAAFTGNANAARRIRRKQRKRQAVYEEGGDYGTGGFGVA